MGIQLSDTQSSVVLNALYTAAEKYRDCAKEVGKGLPEGSGRDSLVAQFKKQADECSELIEKLEQAGA